MKKIFILAFSIAFVTSAIAASKVRLVYGESWSRAGRDVKKTMSSAKFKSECGGQYVVEFVDESGGKTADGNLGALKLPAIFAISAEGRCYCVIDNVPAKATGKQILNKIRQVDSFRIAAEKEGFETAEKCGEFLRKMEKYVGGPRRVISKGFYNDVFDKLKKLDPKDETGWIRHFTLGEEFDKSTKADGLELVIRANKFREDKNFSEGEYFVTRQQKELPVNRLTLEQKQSLLMARFALYREDTSKREEMIKLLNRVVTSGETTFWGTAAIGWLKMLNAPPLSVYWGWHNGDFTGPKLQQTIKYGVDCSFPKTGTYTISFTRTQGEAPRFEEVLLFAGDEEIAKLTKPIVDGDKTSFEVKLPREHRGRVTTMQVRGTASPNGASQGKIAITRHILRPRKEKSSGSGASAISSKKEPVVQYLAKTFGEAVLNEIASKEGGSDFLKTFFADVEWMEQFAGSGVWNGNPWRDDEYKNDAKRRLNADADLAAKSLRALDLLVWNDKNDFITGSKIGRNIATALALNHGGRWDDVKLLQVMECYREWAEDGTLIDDAWTHDVRDWREIVNFGQNAPLSVENLRWIHDFANLDAPRYYGVCWQCAYRLWNCFGASVHGSQYYEPWQHRWNTQELRYRVGGVCGALSKFGSHAAASHGIRSYTAGQPGHCAYMLWDYTNNRWGLAYSVTGYTGPHFSLSGAKFAGVEEVNRFFENPNRMESERFRWKGDYKKALEIGPANYQAADEWRLKIQSGQLPASEWEDYASSILSSFKNAPATGWLLYFHYINTLQSKEQKFIAIRKGLLAMTEPNVGTAEAPYFDELALNRISEIFGGDKKVLWRIFATALEGQAKTKTFYRQTISWGSEKLMSDAETTKKFLEIVGKSAEKTGAALDYRSMILRASEAEDIAMFRQVYSLLEKISPNELPKAGGKKSWPLERNGGQLLSPDGLLRISKTCRYDTPTYYRSVLQAQGTANGNGFHTDGEESPWAKVVLPGSSEITGVTVVNSGDGHNATRQVPLRIWLSDNGTDWQQVYASDKVESEWVWTAQTPIKAKYIKVGRAPNAKKEVFHLHRILVYGKKLY